MPLQLQYLNFITFINLMTRFTNVDRTKTVKLPKSFGENCVKVNLAVVHLACLNERRTKIWKTNFKAKLNLVVLS